MTFQEKMQIAEALAKSGLVPKGLKGENSAEKIFAVMIYGEELGLPLYVSLRNLQIIDGQPCLSADLIKGLMFQTKDISFWDEGFLGDKDANNNYLPMKFDGKNRVWDDNYGYFVRVKRKSIDAEFEATFTIADAKRAGLLSKTNWQAYPQDMVRARAISKIGKIAFPETLSKVYTPEELEVGEQLIPRSENSQSIKMQEPIDKIEIEPNGIKINVEEIDTSENELIDDDKSKLLSEIKKAKQILKRKDGKREEQQQEQQAKEYPIPPEITKELALRDYDVTKIKLFEEKTEEDLRKLIDHLYSREYYTKVFSKIKDATLKEKIKNFAQKVMNMQITVEEIEEINKFVDDYASLSDSSSAVSEQAQ